MPLHLHYTESVAPWLDEILDPLLQRHVDFKLRDSFRLIVPDSESRQDIEQWFLHRERLDGILIGKSILTLSSFAQLLLLEHPDPYPLAALPLQRKVLQLALEETTPEWKLDPPMQRKCLWELRDLERQIPLRDSKRETRGTRLLKKYQEVLATRGRAWTLERSFREAWGTLHRGTPRALLGAEEWWFLGFRLPEASLLECLEGLLHRRPELRVHLYLPPPEQLFDSEGRMEHWRERLDALRPEGGERLAAPAPELRIQPFPTPIHEAEYLIHGCSDAPDTVRLLTGGNGSLDSLLVKRLLDPQGLAGPLSTADTQLLLPLFSELEAQGDSQQPTSFAELLRAWESSFLAWRGRLAETGDFDSLRWLGACGQRLKEWLQAESLTPALRSKHEWMVELREDLLELQLPLPGAHAKKIPLRRLDRAGLARTETVFLADAVDRVLPSAPAPAFFEDEGGRFLTLHEEKLAFAQAPFLARRRIIFSFSQFSLSGRAQIPSPWLGELREARPLPLVESLPTLTTGRHPYFRENAEREHRRHRDPHCDLDRGNLSTLNLQPWVMKKLAETPLSATYLDDYAKCPWRFFARWHLRLREEPEEDLEIDPRRRGTLLHRLLEDVFSGLISAFFSRGKIPSLVEIESALDSAFASLLKLCLEEKSPIPPALLVNQLQRMRDSVLKLLREEQAEWSEASSKLLPRHLEWGFGRGGKPGLEIPLETGVSVPLTGRVDRIDLSQEESHYLLIDYKSSRGGDLAREIREGKSLQFWIYLQAVRRLLYPGQEALGGLYWDMKELKKNQGMARREAYKPFTHRKISGNAKSFLKEEAYSELKIKLEGVVREVLQKILRGDYSLNPAECLGVHCEFREICRYDDKPKS